MPADLGLIHSLDTEEEGRRSAESFRTLDETVSSFSETYGMPADIEEKKDSNVADDKDI